MILTQLALSFMTATAQDRPEFGTTVAMLYAASDTGRPTDVVEQLMCASRGVAFVDKDAAFPRVAYELATVEPMDVNAALPRIQDLVAYDAVLVWNDVAFADPVAVGDLVATMVEAGKGAVVAGNTVDTALGLQGRFLTQRFTPVSYGTAASPGGNLKITATDVDLEWLVGPTLGDTIDWGVVTVDGGTGSHQVQGLAPLLPATVTHQWSNGEPAVVTLTPDRPGQGRVAVVNMMPPSSWIDPGGWDHETQGARLMANALLWTQDFTRPLGQCWQDGPNGPEPQTVDPGAIRVCRDVSECANGNNVECIIIQNLSVFQDLNCNGVDVADEDTFQPIGDTECENNVDPVTGLPYDNLDYYHDFFQFTCEYPTDTYDDDHDQLSAGTIIIQSGGQVQDWEIVSLVCDNCGEYYNPEQHDWDMDGVGDECDDCPYQFELAQADSDEDCLGDACDNCVVIANSDQRDIDDDGNGDACDNCPTIYNPTVPVPLAPPGYEELQADVDFDGAGDACDNCLLHDVDGDGEVENPGYPPEVEDLINPDQLDTDVDSWGDACDNCPDVFNPMQADSDFDLVGDACDNCPGFVSNDRTDRDEDGVGDACDSCDTVRNADQLDLDLDEAGDACDNCPLRSNNDQADIDGDGLGDVCDICPNGFDPEQSDADDDEVGDVCDNCSTIRNEGQEDFDDDGFGDVCDLCPQRSSSNVDTDRDGVGDECDNCPLYANFDQADDDNDGTGNTCDVLGLRGGGELGSQGPTFSCSSVGGRSGGAGALALALVLGLRRRGRSR